MENSTRSLLMEFAGWRFSRTNDALSKHRWENQTIYQRILSIVGLLLIIHYAMGVVIWSLFIYTQTDMLIHRFSSNRFWWELWNWLPFYSRSWKSTMPLVVAIFAIFMVGDYPKWAGRLMGGLLVFTILCACYDISHQDYDFWSHNSKTGVWRYFYFTWWWWNPRS